MQLSKKILEKPVLVLLLVNIYPIIGVLFFGWDYFIVVLLYIIETLIIGLINMLKMGGAQGKLSLKDKANMGITTSDSAQAKEMEEKPGCAKLILIPFFFVHYNMFVVVQSIFVVVLSTQFGNRNIELEQFLNLEFILSLLFLFGSHIYSFYENYILKEEYKQSSIIKLMFLPYKRIIIQQITVIFGSFLIMLTNAPVFFLVILIIMKIFFDLRAHFKVHDSFAFFNQ